MAKSSNSGFFWPWQIDVHKNIQDKSGTVIQSFKKLQMKKKYSKKYSYPRNEFTLYLVRSSSLILLIHLTSDGDSQECGVTLSLHFQSVE